MSDFLQYDEIARLIAMEVSGELTDDEKQVLKSWIEEDSGNEELYARIHNSGNYQARTSEYRDIDSQVTWELLSPKLEEKRKIFIYKRILLYAASIMVPILLIGSAYFYFFRNSPEQPKPVAEVKTMSPGSTKAVLILDNGKSVVLDSAQNLSIVEKDGTQIEKSGGELNYITSSSRGNERPIYNTINIPRGGEYHLVLSDGTEVYLNAMSSIRYPVKFTGDTREVELHGEAYFEVTKDPKCPFIVKTHEINIQVLGTSFNLNAYDNTEEIVTTLVEGRVKINAGKNDESRVLMPNEQATFHVKGGTTEINKVDVNLYTAWKDGNLIFYNNRLEDIMTTLTRWYAADVLYADASVKDLRFSGNLNRRGDIKQILDIMQSTGRIKIEINQNTILFRKKK